LPPDQLVFEHLYDLAADDPFWKNELQFTKDVFTNEGREIINELGIVGKTANIKHKIAEYKGAKVPREVFKRFYKRNVIQKIIASKSKPYNPWKHWVDNNPVMVNEFLVKFRDAMHQVMRNGYAVDAAKLTMLEVKPKKV